MEVVVTMFLALRELRFARGRFALMGLVIALISLLVVLLSGLSSGLVNDGVSGLKALPVTAFAFDEGTTIDSAFSRSIVDEDQLARWRAADGVGAAEPFGLSIVNARSDTAQHVDLTLFGIEPGSFLAPRLSTGEPISGAGDIVVSESLRASGLEVGSVITLDRIGLELRVVGFTEGQATFGHVDVAYLPLGTWRLIAANAAVPGPPSDAAIAAVGSPYASAIAVQAAAGAALDTAAIDEEAGTTSRTLAASPGFQAETLTLNLIQAFLYVICALVVGAFFTIWTIQRTHEIAVLRAIGAGTGYVLRDSLAQAVLLLGAFATLGIAAGVAVGALMPDAMPFELEVAPIVTASMLTVALGLFGAAVAVLRVTRIDPLTALGGAR